MTRPKAGAGAMSTRTMVDLPEPDAATGADPAVRLDSSARRPFILRHPGLVPGSRATGASVCNSGSRDEPGMTACVGRSGGGGNDGATSAPRTRSARILPRNNADDPPPDRTAAARLVDRAAVRARHAAGAARHPRARHRLERGAPRRRRETARSARRPRRPARLPISRKPIRSSSRSRSASRCRTAPAASVRSARSSGSSRGSSTSRCTCSGSNTSESLCWLVSILGLLLMLIRFL